MKPRKPFNPSSIEGGWLRTELAVISSSDVIQRMDACKGNADDVLDRAVREAGLDPTCMKRSDKKAVAFGRIYGCSSSLLKDRIL